MKNESLHIARRDFLKKSAVIASATALGSLPFAAHSGVDDTIKVALVG